MVDSEKGHTKMHILKTLSLACAGFVLAGLPTVSLANHVDYLVDGGFVIGATSMSGPVSSAQLGSPGNILGSEREVTLSFSAGSGILTSGLLVPPGPGPVGPDTSKVLLFDNSVNSFGMFVLEYDGIGSTGLAGSGAGDLTSPAGFVAFRVDFPSVQGSGDLTISVTDTSSNTGSVTQSVNAAGNYTFNFSDAGFAGVDFTSADSITVTLDTTTAASDFAISQIIRLVPEPTSMALLGLGGLTLLRRRR